MCGNHSSSVVLTNLLQHFSLRLAMKELMIENQQLGFGARGHGRQLLCRSMESREVRLPRGTHRVLRILRIDLVHEHVAAIAALRNRIRGRGIAGPERSGSGFGVPVPSM